MNDVTCPYCKTEQEVCHDDGFACDEDREEEFECHHCGREFLIDTYIRITHNGFCKDDDHKWKSWAPNHPDMEGCTECDRARRVMNGH